MQEQSMATHSGDRAVFQNRYQVKTTLGRGGFATTYLCHDMNEGRDVAVKVMRLDELDEWKSFELFEREANILANLEHDGIPDFYEVFQGKDDEGRDAFCLVQEYIEGETLGECIDRGRRFEADEIQRLALGLIDILEYLHKLSPPVFHRDIKPSNILLRADLTPVLIDFGSVCGEWRAEDDAGSTIAGTHGYMPPEQYMGRVSAASDLYAYGATLLHALTGKHPSEYYFDDGCIEVPLHLPCSSELRSLIEQCLYNAVSNRPASAEVVRTLLLEQAGGAQTMPMKRPSYFLELGPAPRDPEGPHRDVYKMLVPDFFSAGGSSTILYPPGEGSKTSAWSVTKFFLLTLCTFGAWAAFAVALARGRNSKQARLFTHGTFVVGQVSMVVVGEGMEKTGVLCGFSTHGRGQQKMFWIHGDNARPFAIGDPIGVLYDPTDATISSIVFR